MKMEISPCIFVCFGSRIAIQFYFLNYYLLFWNVELELVKIFLIFSGGDGKKRKKQNKTKNSVPWNSLAQQLKKEAKKQPGNYFLSFYFKLLVNLYSVIPCNILNYKIMNYDSKLI